MALVRQIRSDDAKLSLKRSYLQFPISAAGPKSVQEQQAFAPSSHPIVQRFTLVIESEHWHRADAPSLDRDIRPRLKNRAPCLNED